MAKDPAVLFYTSDFLSGVIDMDMDERGQYITLLCAQHQKGRLSEKTIRLLVGSVSVSVLAKFKRDENGLYFNERMEFEAQKRSKYVESRRSSRKKADEDSVRIYIVRDNIRGIYKIGSSVNPLRRYNELMNQKNPAIMNDEAGSRDMTLLWYSDIIERSVEKQIHNQYVNKHINGEWFALDQTDIDEIVNTYKGEYVKRMNERTNLRTENENENDNLNEKDKGGVGEKGKTFFEKSINDELWQESVMRSCKINNPAHWINEFNDHANATQEHYNTIKDWRRHCVNWIKKEILKEKDKPHGTGKQTSADRNQAYRDYIANA
jgi:hypothetical protein